MSVFSQSVAGNLTVTLLFSSLPKADFKYNLNPIEPLGPCGSGAVRKSVNGSKWPGQVLPHLLALRMIC